MWRAAGCVVLGCVLACVTPKASPTPTERKKPPLEVRKQLEPFDVKDAQKVPHQAVILGTDDNGGSTVIELAAKPSPVEVDVMWVRVQAGKSATGGSTKAKLTTAPQSDGAVRVGIYEQFSGGLGPQWRSAVWISAFLASTMLGKDLTDFKFTAEAEGFIDGPSAGGLITAGFLASLTGDDIDRTVTMTGTINPDGTIGPVGGIPQKFVASARAGKNKLGYPVGLRRSVDANTGKYVDLHKLAKKHGAKAVELGDVYDAYELLTGRRLPTPVPLSAREMRLDSDVEVRITAAYESWRKEVADRWSQVIAMRSGQKVPAALLTLANLASSEAGEAEKLFNQGMLPSAYERITKAAILARSAHATLRIVEHMEKGDRAAALGELRMVDIEDELAKVLRDAAAVKADTIGGHLHMMSAFQEAITGWGFSGFGSQLGADADAALTVIAAKAKEQPATTTPKKHDDGLATANNIVEAVLPAVLANHRAAAYVQITRDRIDIEAVDSLDYECALPSVQRLATSYSSAAAANIKYFDALLLTQVASALRVTETRARQFILRREPDYLVAAMAFAMHQNPTGLTEKLRAEWGEESLPWRLSSLSGGLLSYFKTSLLINKWYALAPTINAKTGRVDKVAHEKAFINMITSAERKAREHARSAKIATGLVPLQAKLRYQAAVVLRERGDLTDKLRALELFWAASMYSQAAVMLARNPEPAKP